MKFSRLVDEITPLPYPGIAGPFVVDDFGDIYAVDLTFIGPDEAIPKIIRIDSEGNKKPIYHGKNFNAMAIHPERGLFVASIFENKIYYFEKFPHFVSMGSDFSKIFSNPDGTFTRRLKDGTRINFDSNGFMKSIEDTNGNKTIYEYSGELLAKITYPSGDYYEFFYSNGKLQRVVDSAGRTTYFEIDSSGDLTTITNCKGHSTRFSYINHLLTSHTDERNYTTEYVYNDKGMVVEARFPNGEIRKYEPYIDKIIVNNLPEGVGTENNPADPFFKDKIFAKKIDGKGNEWKYQINHFGSVEKVVDPIGKVTTITRDENNLTLTIWEKGINIRYDSMEILFT
jgi:RHS Repeat.